MDGKVKLEGTRDFIWSSITVWSEDATQTWLAELEPHPQHLLVFPSLHPPDYPEAGFTGPKIWQLMGRLWWEEKAKSSGYLHKAALLPSGCHPDDSALVRQDRSSFSNNKTKSTACAQWVVAYDRVNSIGGAREDMKSGTSGLLKELYLKTPTSKLHVRNLSCTKVQKIE